MSGSILHSYRAPLVEKMFSCLNSCLIFTVLALSVILTSDLAFSTLWSKAGLLARYGAIISARSIMSSLKVSSTEQNKVSGITGHWRDY